MPAVNRVVCLLSNPLAAQRGVEGRLVELPIIDTESEATNLQEALREGSEDTGLEVELQMRYATVDALRSSMTLGAKICRATSSSCGPSARNCWRICSPPLPRRTSF